MAASGSFSESTAVATCAAMAVFYIAILYSPTILRLLPPISLQSFMLRCLACAVVSSLIYLLFSSFLLGVGAFKELPFILNVYGIRSDHAWQAVAFPLLLTGLLYAGSFVSRALLFIHAWKRSRDGFSFGACLFGFVERCLQGARSSANDVVALAQLCSGIINTPDGKLVLEEWPETKIFILEHLVDVYTKD